MWILKNSNKIVESNLFVEKFAYDKDGLNTSRERMDLGVVKELTIYIMAVGGTKSQWTISKASQY